MRKLLVFIIIFLLGIFIAKGWWNSQISPVSSDEQSSSSSKSTRIFVVDKGEGFAKVAQELKKENLIKSTWAFTVLGKQTGLGSKLQAGTFRLSPSYSSEEILKILAGKPLDVWVTLLEGWRVEEMAKKLNDTLGTNQQEFIKQAKEGYMSPDTYLFPKDYTAGQIAQRLEDTFDQKYTADLKSKIRQNGLTDKEGVILASLVEREARSDKARIEVASILLKRFKIGMGLNADATIQYALGYQPLEKSWWKKTITKADKEIDSPYNTYLNAGLPPAPICNPSFSSLEAVANADSNTPYLYYYHDSNGVSHYAKTREEHDQNVARYP